MTTDLHNERLARVRSSLRRSHLDAILIKSAANMLYLTGFPGQDSSLLVPSRGRPFFFADPREYPEAVLRIAGAEIITAPRLDSPLVRNVLKKKGIKQLGFEPDQTSYELYMKMRHAIHGASLAPFAQLVEILRSVKSPGEVTALKDSARLLARALVRRAAGIRPLRRESEIAATIDMRIRKGGGTNSFDTIVASGARSSCPHATTSQRKVGANDMVLIDCGARVRHYCSDMTRVFFLGKARRRIRAMFDVIREAHALALSLIRPDAVIATIALMVNRYIESKGFGAYLLHGLGHGIGLEIHELPVLSVKNSSRIRKGMVFTVEPGIYAPGVGGVRIEDMVHVGERRIEILTQGRETAL